MKRVILLLFLTTGCQAAPSPPKDATADSLYRWFTLPIEVENLPAKGDAIPVRHAIDFTAILQDLKVAGAVDERSLSLQRVGGKDDVPLQYSAALQPRPKERRALPDTPKTISLVAEYDAKETPATRVAGELAWIASPDAAGKARYLLRFGVLKAGRFVQVPFPPQNLRAFGPDGQATPIRQFPHMQTRPQFPKDGVVHLHDDQQLVTSYHLGPRARIVPPREPRRPFLYPVHGPDGIPLTEFGKPHDPTGSHAHHYGLWVAHVSVNGHDFWSEKGGVIVHQQLELQEDGPVFCRLVQRAAWIAPPHPTLSPEGRGKGEGDLMQERRTTTLYRTFGKYRLIDIELDLTPNKEAVTFGKTSFGFLAARVAQSMTVFDGGGEIRNAKGERNEQGCHLKKAEWIDQSGPITADKWGGLAILDHPENPNYPTGWHCRNDGWAGAAFNLDGDTVLKPGEKLRLRYRIHLHQGNSVTGEVARRFEEYGATPRIKVGKPAPQE